MKKLIIFFVTLLLLVSCSQQAPESDVIGTAVAETQIPTITIGEGIPEPAQDVSITTESSIPIFEEEAVEVDDGMDNETIEENYSLSSAETANSGTQNYIWECKSAIGTAPDCICGSKGEGENTFHFSNGKLGFGDSVSKDFFYVRINTNTYQYVEYENNIVAKILFSENGFEWIIEGSDDNGTCKRIDSYFLSAESPPIGSSESQPISINDLGFGQYGNTVGFAFIAENPNTDFSIEGSQYQLFMLDMNGDVVGTETGRIDLLLPGQTLGVGGTISQQDDVTITQLDVKIFEGDYTLGTRPNPFQVESTNFFSNYPNTGYVSGIIHNMTWEDFPNLRVSAIVYDVGGNIIGGGETYLNFLLGNNSRGVAVPVTSVGDVYHVELYPALSSLIQRANEETPDPSLGMQLTNYGYGQNGSRVGYGIIVENPYLNYAVAASQFHVTAFSSDGSVLATNEGDINLILPEQDLGVGGYLHVEESMEIAYVDVQIRDGVYLQTEPYPLLTFENVVYQPDQEIVTGDLNIPYPSDDLDDLRIYAIAYDENDQIIGGGDSYDIYDISSNYDRATVEVYLIVSEYPAKVELFASVAILSLME